MRFESMQKLEAKTQIDEFEIQSNYISIGKCDSIRVMAKKIIPNSKTPLKKDSYVIYWFAASYRPRFWEMKGTIQQKLKTAKKRLPPKVYDEMEAQTLMMIMKYGECNHA